MAGLQEQNVIELLGKLIQGSQPHGMAQQVLDTQGAQAGAAEAQAALGALLKQQGSGVAQAAGQVGGTLPTLTPQSIADNMGNEAIASELKKRAKESMAEQPTQLLLQQSAEAQNRAVAGEAEMLEFQGRSPQVTGTNPPTIQQALRPGATTPIKPGEQKGALQQPGQQAVPAPEEQQQLLGNLLTSMGVNFEEPKNWFDQGGVTVNEDGTITVRKGGAGPTSQGTSRGMKELKSILDITGKGQELMGTQPLQQKDILSLRKEYGLESFKQMNRKELAVLNDQLNSTSSRTTEELQADGESILGMVDQMEALRGGSGRIGFGSLAKTVGLNPEASTYDDLVGAMATRIGRYIGEDRFTDKDREVYSKVFPSRRAVGGVSDKKWDALRKMVQNKMSSGVGSSSATQSKRSGMPTAQEATVAKLKGAVGWDNVNNVWVDAQGNPV